MAKKILVRIGCYFFCLFLANFLFIMCSGGKFRAGTPIIVLACVIAEFLSRKFIGPNKKDDNAKNKF
jgi:hypothetical protein